MKCRLCGEPLARSGKLCGECATALKRAGTGPSTVRNAFAGPMAGGVAAGRALAPFVLDWTVPLAWQLSLRRIPSESVALIRRACAGLAQMVSRGLRRPAPDGSTTSVAALARDPHPAARRRVSRRAVAWTAAALIATAGAYAAQRLLQRPPMPAPTGATAPRTATSQEPEPASGASGSAASPSAAGAKPAEAATPKGPRQPSTTAKAKTAPPAAARAKAGAGAADGTANTEPANAEAPPPAAGANDLAAETPATGPRPGAQAGPPSTSSGSPVADRWQALATALERCGREGVFAGVICEQKARLQYCDGAWGEAPLCTSKSRVER